MAAREQLSVGLLAAVAGASALAGCTASRALFGAAEAAPDDDEDDALIELALEKVDRSPAEPAAGSAVDEVIALMRSNPKSFEAKPAAPPAPPRAAPAAPAAAASGASPLTEEKVEGVVEAHSDGSRTFDRLKDLGMKFTISDEWAGLEEVSEAMPHGTMWMARFGDPRDGGQPGMASRQLVLICEQVPGGMPIEAYAEKSKQSANEAMGQFSTIKIESDGPISVGPFERVLSYTQVIPMMPGSGMTAPMELKMKNFMAMRNGVAYTVQMVGPPAQFVDAEEDFTRIAQSFTIGGIETKRGVLTHDIGLLRSQLPSELGVVIAGTNPPAELTDTFTMGGELMTTYMPLDMQADGASPVSVVVDCEEAAAETIDALADKLPADVKGSLRVLGNERSAPDVLEYTCIAKDGSPVAVSMRRVEGAPRLRVVGWFTLSDKKDATAENLTEKWKSHKERGLVHARVVKLSSCFTLGSTTSEEKVGYRHDAMGVSVGALAPQCFVMDNSIGSPMITIRPNREMDHIDMQLQQRPRKGSLDECVEELRRDLAQAQGQIQEESTGWLGRDKVHRILAHIPGPPADQSMRPTVLTVFITLVNTERNAWVIQWRCLAQMFDQFRDRMEEMANTVRFTEPQA